MADLQHVSIERTASGRRQNCGLRLCLRIARQEKTAAMKLKSYDQGIVVFGGCCNVA
jgi:hypothetical protein